MTSAHRILLSALVTLSLVVAGGASLAPAVQAQTTAGTAFTYQGQLTQAGAPVSGTCDFQFSLFDAATAGSQVGSTLSQSLGVSGGLFITLLDFGTGTFDGNARWLEIAVRCPAGSGDYSTLSPRQELSPTPYAIWAARVPWSGIQSIPGDLADGDDDTTYTAGPGLILAGNEFSANPTYLQWRVNGTCASGSSIRVINADGTVTCETDTDTTYAAGAGLSLAGNTFSADTSYLQRRVTGPSGTCADGSSIRIINEDGTVTCEADDTYTDTGSGARAYHNAAQSVANGIWTALAFNGERWDDGGYHDNATNNSRLTVAEAGLYLLSCTLEFASNSTGARGVSIRVNGGTFISADQRPANTNANQLTIATVYKLAANGYAECMAYQTSGSPLSVNSVAQFTPEFTIARLP